MTRVSMSFDHSYDNLSTANRNACRYCRFKRCLVAGMQRSCEFARSNHITTRKSAVQNGRDSIATTRSHRSRQEAITQPTLLPFDRHAIAIEELGLRTNVINTAQLNVDSPMLTDTEHGDLVREKAAG